MISEEIQHFYHESALNFATYWTNFLEANPPKESLVLEVDNLLLAFHKMIEFRLLDLALYSHKAVYFFENQGLFSSLKKILIFIDENKNKVDDPEIAGRNYQFLGRLEFRSENFEIARDYFLDGLKLAEQFGLAELSGKLYRELAELCFELHEYEITRDYLQSALAIAEANNNLIEKSHLLAILSKVAYFQGQFDEATKYCEICLPLSKDLNVPENCAAVLTYLGVISYAKKDFKVSQVYMLEGLQFARQSGDTNRINNLLTNLGSLATELEEIDDASKYLEEALRLSKQLGSTGYITHILMDLGLIKFNLGEKEQAEIYITESVTSAREYDDWSLLMHVLSKRSQFHIDQQQLQLGIDDLEEAINLDAPSNSRVSQRLAAAHWELTTAYDALGKPEKAIENAQKSLELYKTIDSPEQSKVAEWLDMRA